MGSSQVNRVMTPSLAIKTRAMLHPKTYTIRRIEELQLVPPKTLKFPVAAKPLTSNCLGMFFRPNKWRRKHLLPYLVHPQHSHLASPVITDQFRGLKWFNMAASGSWSSHKFKLLGFDFKNKYRYLKLKSTFPPCRYLHFSRGMAFFLEGLLESTKLGLAPWIKEWR